MAAYPPKLTLPYRLAPAYIEERTLAGELVDPVQSITVELDMLGDDSLRDRAKALFLNVDTRHFARTGTVEVMSSGVEVCTEKRADGRTIRMPAPIVLKIGSLPVLPTPVTDPVQLIEAYEPWIAAYVELAPVAIADWLTAWATDADPDEDGCYPNGATAGTFTTTMFLRANGRERHVEVDGRFDDPEHFRRVRAAYALYHFAANTVSDEDWKFALTIVGRGAELSEDWAETGDETIVAYEKYAERVAAVAFARSWNRQRGKGGFDLETRRWAAAHGSERLRIGLEDGYRMVPVYLKERIGAEVPGFYAYLPKDDDDVMWQPRTGPSEAALLWRRFVQTELDEHCPPSQPAPRAEIVWMRTPPDEMVDQALLYDVDYQGYQHPVDMEPFEAIAVPGWLGRYTLLAGVYSPEFPPPAYAKPEFVLRPSDYKVASVPEPPDPKGGDIPIDTGDFASSGAANDDIPF